MWIKVWTKWAWGTTKNHPDYHEVNSQDEIDEQLYSMNEAQGWSDKYRGADYEIIEFPPAKFLEQEVERLERVAKYQAETAKRYKKLLEKYIG